MGEWKLLGGYCERIGTADAKEGMDEEERNEKWRGIEILGEKDSWGADEV